MPGDKLKKRCINVNDLIKSRSTDNLTNRLFYHLIGLEHSPHHLATGEHIHPHIDVSLPAIGAAVALHPLQALLGPVVVGEQTVAGVEKHPEVEGLRQTGVRRR